jgi:dTDP-glucose 4,6-dehydratase
MRILVTGGAGFMGSELVRQSVDKGYEVIVVDKLTYAADVKRLGKYKDKITFYVADLSNKEQVKKIFEQNRPDIVVHMAAETHVDRSIKSSEEFIETNVKGTMNLLDGAKETGIEKFLNISTDEVYGSLGQDGQFTEFSPLNPNSPYSASKASADMLGRAYFKTFGLPVITLRPSNYYGPWQYPEKLIPVMVLKAHMNEKLPVYGRGENVREWIYISDVAEAVFRLIEKGKPGEIYNVGSGEERKNIDTVKSVLSIMNKPESLIEYVADRPGHDFRYSLSNYKIKGDTGWEPKVKFEEGIEKTVRWYLDNIGWMESKLNELKSYWEKAYYKE